MLDNGWFARIVLVFWLVCAVFLVFLLRKIDWIVHHELYNFGLQFSEDWALEYWATFRVIFTILAFSACFSAGYFVLDVMHFIKGRRYGTVKREPVEPVRRVKRDVKGVEQNHMLISCPKCKKVFSKPLVMLDFSSGRSRLANVCPYCNFVLGWGEAEERNVGVLNPEERKVKSAD